MAEFGVHAVGAARGASLAHNAPTDAGAEGDADGQLAPSRSALPVFTEGGCKGVILQHYGHSEMPAEGCGDVGTVGQGERVRVVHGAAFGVDRTRAADADGQGRVAPAAAVQSFLNQADQAPDEGVIGRVGQRGSLSPAEDAASCTDGSDGDLSAADVDTDQGFSQVIFHWG